jgi:hypothetical protein
VRDATQVAARSCSFDRAPRLSSSARRCVGSRVAWSGRAPRPGRRRRS